MAVGKDGTAAMLSEMCRRGFNVVSANYAFATEYRFPAQIEQVDELFAHLLARPEYGLDMDRVVLMGSSAGANLTAIYGLAVADKSYAEKLGIFPCIKPEQLKVLVIDEMILNGDHLSKGLKILASSWLGERTAKYGPKAKMINIAQHIEKNYFPAFLVASNVEPPFEMDAREMYEKLTGSGVPTELYYRSKAEGEELAHGFMANLGSNTCSRECFKQMMSFVSRWI